MTSAIVDHLWQSTLFALVTWVFTLALRNNAARVRYWVWMAASIKFLIPFSLLTLLGNQFSWQSSAVTSTSNVFISAVQQLAEPLTTPEIVLRSPQAQAFDFLPFVLSIWILGCVFLLTRWGMSWLSVVSAVRKAEPLAMQTPIIVRSSPVMSEPGVVGVVRPVLLLPEGIAARLTTEQLQAILAHELCHVRRRDNLTAAIHMLVEVLFWFHPLVWWIGARLVEERERACDEGVVELGNEPQAYAEGILKVCQFYMESKLTCVAGVSGANLKHRVESIMSNRVIDNMNAAKKALLGTVALAVLCVPVAVGVVTSSQVQAQDANTLQLVFDEVSIKFGGSEPAPGAAKPNQWMFNGKENYSVKNMPLSEIVAFAYNVHKSAVTGGPAWVYSQNFDVEAKAAAALHEKFKGAQYGPMVQTMLRDRFNLQVHRESRQVPAYVMTIGNPETVRTSIVVPPMPPADFPAWMKRETQVRPDRTGLAFESAAMSDLTGYLQVRLKRPVIDKTGLTGKYNFGITGKDVARFDGSASTEVFIAAMEQQLGLTLVSQNAPIDVVVIDYAQEPTLDSVLPASPIAYTDSPNQFTGERMNMRFRDIEVREVLKAITLVAQQNIVVDSRVDGTITIAFHNIPWDQALDEVVQAKGLVMRRKGNVFLVETKG